MPVLLASLVAAVATYIAGAFCSLPLYADGVLKFILFMALYIGWSGLFRPEAYQLFCVAAKPITKKLKRKINKK